MDYYSDTVHPGLGTGTHHDEGSDHGSSKRVFSRNSRIVHPNVSLSRCHSAWATQQSPVGAWHRLVLSFVFTWGPSITSPASEALLHPLNSTRGWFIITHYYISWPKGFRLDKTGVPPVTNTAVLSGGCRLGSNSFTEREGHWPQRRRMTWGVSLVPG